MQARQELQEAQRQLQDLERQEREISITDKTRAQECRRKIAAAQSKVQVCIHVPPRVRPVFCVGDMLLFKTVFLMISHPDF